MPSVLGSTLLGLAALACANASAALPPLRYRGGASASQVVLAASGSVVTLGGAKVVVDGQKKSSDQEREATTWLGLALLGWGVSKFTSIATGSETLYCRLNALPIATSLLFTRQQLRERGAPRWRLRLFQSLRVLGSLYTYVGFVRCWDGRMPRTLVPLLRMMRSRSAVPPRIDLPARERRLHLA